MTIEGIVTGNIQEETVETHSKALQRRARIVLTVAAAIIGLLLITGCGPGASGSSGAQQLEQEFPWLAPLGLSFISGLIQQYGSDLVALLIAAAAAL